MNDHTLRVLEYDKVANIVSGFAASEAGRDAVLAFLPAVDAGTVGSLSQRSSRSPGIANIGEFPLVVSATDISS